MIVLDNARLFRPSALHVCSVGRYNSLAEFINFQNGNVFGGLGWPANNRAIYTPITMPERFTVARFMSANSNATGNTDIGLYDANGNRLLSTGTTARSGAPAMQYVDVTDQSFPPGHYYLAMVVSSTSGNVFRTTLSTQYEARMCGMLQEALGSTVLPATMAPASYDVADIYCYGFTQSDSL